VAEELWERQCTNDCPAERVRIERSGFDSEVIHLLKLSQMIRGGLRLGPDDLWPDEWRALGIIAEARDAAGIVHAI